MPVPPREPSATLADSVRSILSARGLSLAQLSRRSQDFENRLAHIPHSFYGSLRNPSFTPSLHQLHSLSRLSGYRLVDWLALLGFFLDDVSRFQLQFPSRRTVELDATVYRHFVCLPHLHDLREADFAAPLTPLSQWVVLGSPCRVEPFLRNAKNPFRYLKIGSHDAFAFPELLPGSIVRVKEDSSVLERIPIGKRPGRTLFLVRHYGGMACSRLFRTERERIVLCSRQLPYAPIELRVGTEAAVLGRVDLEFRPLLGAKPVVSARLERYRLPRPLDQTASLRDVGGFIRDARISCGLSFREASCRTRAMARQLGDRRYYCSPSALSDYETRKNPPRHVHKIISICAVYFAKVGRFLEACGISLDIAGERTMPAAFLSELDANGTPPKRPRFLHDVEQRFGPVPWFLRTAGRTLFGLPGASPRDLFWVGDSPKTKQSRLAGARLLVVDRRRKRPKLSLSCPSWAQPIFVLQRRDGAYVWGFCRLERGTLVLYGPDRSTRVTRFRNRVDAEVVGRVVGVIRSLR